LRNHRKPPVWEKYQFGRRFATAGSRRVQAACCRWCRGEVESERRWAFEDVCGAVGLAELLVVVLLRV
jgi:hypothetical protein